MAPSRIALVIAGGDRPSPNLLAILPPLALTIAADSGVDHARSLDIPVDAVVGDLDSASPAAIEWARSNGAEIEEHPTDKDQTDLELALARAADNADELIVIGLDGGRIDHWLANLLALAGPHSETITTTAYLGRCCVSIVRTRRTLRGRAGELVTLLAVNGPAEGVTTVGLRYPLNDETLASGSARGVSNVFLADRATVSVRSGTLIALQPHALDG